MRKIQALTGPEATPPATQNGKVGKTGPPRRVPNRERRTREHLTPAEVERLFAARWTGRTAR